MFSQLYLTLKSTIEKNSNLPWPVVYKYPRKIVLPWCRIPGKLFEKIDNDSSITVPGTGVMAYHTNTIQFSIDDFKASNMADIWAAKKAKELNIEIICLKHQANWIRQSLKINHAETIYANCNKKDDFQTKVINSFL